MRFGSRPALEAFLATCQAVFRPEGAWIIGPDIVSGPMIQASAFASALPRKPQSTFRADASGFPFPFWSDPGGLTASARVPDAPSAKCGRNGSRCRAGRSCGIRSAAKSARSDAGSGAPAPYSSIGYVRKPDFPFSVRCSGCSRAGQSSDRPPRRPRLSGGSAATRTPFAGGALKARRAFFGRSRS